jgi:phosphoglycerate dehydrogenase-like enzyme
MRILVPESMGEKQLRQMISEYPQLEILTFRIEQRRSFFLRVVGALAKRTLSYSIYQRFRSKLEAVHQVCFINGRPLEGSLPAIEILVANWAVDIESADLLVEALPDLRWIHSMVTGVDHFNLSVLRERDIKLTSPRAVHAKRIAEFVLALIFADAKNLFEHFEATRARKPRFMASREMSSLVVGVLGFGGIGQAVARLALSNGMSVKAFVRTSREDFQSVSFVSDLGEFLAGIDVLVMALPLTEMTKNLISEREIEMMKPECMLINVGRGGTLCEASVVRALELGKLRRACIDVVEDPVSGRPAFAPPANHPVYRLRNILFTSYSSSESVNSGDELFGDMMDNLRRYMAGEPLPGLIDLERGY